MNWLDFILLAVLIVGAFMGMRLGLIAAAVTALGAFIGWLLAGQLSDDIGGLFEGSLSNDTLVTVISYAIIIGGSLFVARLVAKIVKPLLTVFTLGLSSLVDKLGGLALGLVIGAAIAGAIVIGLARLTYDFDTSVITGAIPTQVAGQVAQIQEKLDKVEDVKKGLEDALTESSIVPILVDIRGALPANALGFVPSDFKIAMDILEANIDRKVQ